MSALPAKTDIDRQPHRRPLSANSGLMQRSKMKSLFDHLIGALFVPNLTYAYRQLKLF
jgi:hypothetical protein